MPGDQETDRPKIDVTLVHGTWGRTSLPFSGPRWFDDGSEFTVELRRLLESFGAEVTFRVFSWSGSNSLEARRLAAARLRNDLWREATRNPGVVQVIIGHSHGGSICMLALHGLPEGLDPILVTLATPFVEVVNAEPKGRPAVIRRVISGGLGPVILLMTINIVEPIFDVPVLSWIFTGSSAFTLAANVLSAVYGLPRKDEADDDKTEVPDWIRPEKTRGFKFFTESTAGGASLDRPRKALILRGVDDEAGLVLAAGSIGSRILSIFVSISFRTATILTIAFVVIAALGLAQDYLPQLTPLKEFFRLLLSSYLIYFAFGCIGAIYFLPLLSGLFKCVYGRELLFGGFFCEIKSASAPDASSDLTITTLPPTNRRGMRHGIYRHSDAPGTIARFIHASMPAPKMNSN